MTQWNGKKRKNAIRSDAKFDKVPTIPIIRNLVALGFTECDIGIVLGAAPSTISSWKQRYPDLFQANAEGKKIMKGILVAEMMRAAIGYEYEEKDETFKELPVLDDSGNKTGEYIKVLDKTVVHKKHQPGNSSLMTFLANNLLPADFPRDPIVVENNILQIIGGVEPNRIADFAGKLLEMGKKYVESKEIKSDES